MLLFFYRKNSVYKFLNFILDFIFFVIMLLFIGKEYFSSQNIKIFNYDQFFIDYSLKGFFIYFLLLIISISYLLYILIFLIKNNKIHQRVNFLFSNQKILKFFHKTSYFSSLLTILCLLMYFVNHKDNEMLPAVVIFFTFIILLYIYFLYPIALKSNKITDIYKKEIFDYDMFFDGYAKPFGVKQIPILSLRVNINDGIFNKYDLDLLHSYLIMIRSLHMDIKSILWFPEIIFIPFLLNFGSNEFAIWIIFLLTSLFLLKLYSLYLLTSYLKKPLNLLLLKGQLLGIEISIENKLKNILMKVDKQGIKIEKIKSLKEFLPIIG